MIAIGSDHAGFALKQAIMAHLKELGIDFKDYGTYDDKSCDYPDYAEAVCKAIIEGDAENGILVCGTGIGISIAANRHREIRAAVCTDEFTARATREHNDANIVTVSGRFVDVATNREIVRTFLETEFGGGRHAGRVEKIMALER